MISKIVIIALATVLSCLSAKAQVWPIKGFTISEGLSHNNVNQVFQDSTGFLWIATPEGLSRYNGYEFKNYGTTDGLPGGYINDVTTDRSGHLWVAINDGGLARLADGGRGKTFEALSIADRPRANNAGRIIFDAENRLWCATEGGIFRARSLDLNDGDFELIGPIDGEQLRSREAFLDRSGNLWFGLIDRVVRVANNKLEFFNLGERRKADVVAITEDQNGRLFTATDFGLYEFVEGEGRWRNIRLDLTKSQTIRTMLRAANGGLWIGTTAGLIHYLDGRQTFYTTENGLTSDHISVAFTDREGSLWLGTIGGGLMRRSNNAVVTFPPQKGLLSTRSYRVVDDITGNIYVQTGCEPESMRIVKIADQTASALSVPGLNNKNCRENNFFQNTDGRWWFMTEDGIKVSENYDLSNPIALRPKDEKYDLFSEIYADRDASVWLGTYTPGLYIADPSGKAIRRVDGGFESQKVSLLLRDSHGKMWIGDNSFLGRLNDSKLEEIKADGLVEKIQPRALFEDSRGRLWIGTRYDGVLYTDDPGSPSPNFSKIDVAGGLASNSIWTIAEDNRGTIYFGTGRGVDRYDSATGRIRHFTAEDGVAESVINHLFKDKSGRIWVASDAGLARIEPSLLDESLVAPQISIESISIAGEELSLPETGIASFAAGELSPDQNDLSIRFVGLSLKGERSLNYQYKLDGDQEWSAPGKQREVNLVNLGAGQYRFLMRAINQSGIASETPAIFEFQVLRPVWQRWWFLALVGMVIVGIIYFVYKYRLRRFIEIERMRTRIATDLHDDIGSNLTRIALMTEVLNQQGSNGSSREMLPSIANIARESVASMNDIVWAISPEHDRVLDLTRRMRQHAEEVFTIRDIELNFSADSSDLKLNVGIRRDVLLIFKEAVNNAARHSQCTRVEIDFGCTASRLQLRITDNGRGFVEDAERDGHGLTSMTRRASLLGGELNVSSTEGGGTTVLFDMPL